MLSERMINPVIMYRSMARAAPMASLGSTKVLDGRTQRPPREDGRRIYIGGGGGRMSLINFDPMCWLEDEERSQCSCNCDPIRSANSLRMHRLPLLRSCSGQDHDASARFSGSTVSPVVTHLYRTIVFMAHVDIAVVVEVLAPARPRSLTRNVTDYSLVFLVSRDAFNLENPFWNSKHVLPGLFNRQATRPILPLMPPRLGVVPSVEIHDRHKLVVLPCLSMSGNDGCIRLYERLRFMFAKGRLCNAIIEELLKCHYLRKSEQTGYFIK